MEKTAIWSCGEALSSGAHCARKSPENLKLSRRRRSAGHAVVEVALVAPWIFFLFAGALDMGYYAYALIGVESAARTAAIYASKNASAAADNTTACTYALQELAHLPYAPTTCITSGSPTNDSSSSSVIVVTASYLHFDATAGTKGGVDGADATNVTIDYRTPQMVPIPLLLPGQLDIKQTVQMRIRQ